MMSLKLSLALACAFLALLWPKPLHAHGDLELRIADLTRQIQSATNSAARLYLERGELQREHLNFASATADYDAAARLDPALVQVDFCRARLLADSGKLSAARSAFDQALDRSPTNGQGFVERARVLIKLSQRKPAIADFRRGLDLLDKPQPELFLELARALDAEGQPAEALSALDQGIIKLGPLPILQEFAVDLDLRQKNYASALARLDAVTQRALRKERWLARRGEILLAAGNTNEAQQAYEAALAAIKILPGRLQQSPPMQTFQAQVQKTLAGITSAPPPAPRN